MKLENNYESFLYNFCLNFSGLPSRGAVDPQMIVNAEEATEIPSIDPLYIDTDVTPTNKSQTDRRKIFEKIGQQEFEDVVFTPERKSKKSDASRCQTSKNDKANDSEDSMIARAKSRINDIEEKTTYASLLTLSIDDDCTILRAERNLESIQKDVENKEKLLADVLNFDLTEFMTNSQAYSPDAGANNSLNSITYLNCIVPTNEPTRIEVDRSLATETDSGDDDESYNTELKKLQELGECSKRLLQIKTSAQLDLRANGRIINAINSRANAIDPQERERNFNSKYMSKLPK